MNVGDKIKILPPFGEFFPDEYTVSVITDDYVQVEELESAFAYCYIEAV